MRVTADNLMSSEMDVEHEMQPPPQIAAQLPAASMEDDMDKPSVDTVLALLELPMKKGESWYLVDKRWMETFKSYIKTGDASLNPGPIDNSPLFKNGASKEVVKELKERLQEDLDYTFVPAEAWHLLVNEFGLVDEYHTVKRQVIEQGHFSSFCIVEVYPIELKLCLYGVAKEDVITKPFSRVTTLHELESEMRRLFNIAPDKDTQLWASGGVLNPHPSHAEAGGSSSGHHHLSLSSAAAAAGSSSSPSASSSSTFVAPSSRPTPAGTGKANDSQTLADAGLNSGSIVTLEVKNADGTWPSCRPRYGSVATRSSKCTPGLCGLMNLGNTCFMNSALQCMSNTTPLTDYFLSDTYLREINVDNPLGMNGQIAKAYGDLIKSMWSGCHSCLAPREFKMAVGRFAPQFSGFQQQDCQELMAFLLDGLHEDLNRITQKPYIEIKDGIERRPDEVVAAESWTNYKKRNDSIIVDTFHGLLKSTLVCPDCELVSVTFDPFCYLSLPLPVKRERAVEVTFIPATPIVNQSSSPLTGIDSKSKMIRMIKISKLMIPKIGTISEICVAVAKVVNDSKELLGSNYTVDADRLIVADVYNHRFHKLYSNDDTYPPQLDDFYVYETLEEKTPIPVYLREVRSGDSTVLFGQPLIVNVEDTSYEALCDAISMQLKNYLKVHDSSLGVDGEENAPNNGHLLAAPASLNEDETESDTDEGVSGCDDSGDLFTLTLVNSYGSIDHEKLDRSKPIKLNNKSYLAADFRSKVRERYSDEREEQFAIKIQLGRNAGSSKVTVALNDCIQQFTTTEKLGADDPWYCPRCKKHQEATKKFDLWSLPKVLIIHLKRFSYSRFWRDKLDTLVDFPLSGLNMAPFVIDNAAKEKACEDKMTYDLIAVANHYGGLGGGHYTAYGKNRETGQWHYFDDSNVSLASEDNVVSRAAYVLFYLRRDQ